MRQYQVVRGSSEGYGQDRLSPRVFRSPHSCILRQVKGRSSGIPRNGNYGREVPLPSRISFVRFLTLGTNLDGTLPFGDDCPVATLRARRSTPRLLLSPPRLNFLVGTNSSLWKNNKSLHPIRPCVPAFAWCSRGKANAGPPVRTGELNRYPWETDISLRLITEH